MSTTDPPGLRRQFDKLLGHLPAGVAAHCPDGRILSGYQQARALLGQAEAQSPGPRRPHGHGAPMPIADVESRHGAAGAGHA
jgi:hypothetical protein